MYDTVIVFDRVRENIPILRRYTASQVVNESLAETITRSLNTSLVTLIPVVLLFVFGSGSLKDFAFALVVGIASGAYSSIFIASPVLTHWKEREPQYRSRRRRIVEDLGYVPAYAAAAADVEPTDKKPRRPGRITTPDDPDKVSAAEFEQMKRDIVEPEAPSRRTSTLTKAPPRQRPKPAPARPAPPPAPEPEPQPEPDADVAADAAAGQADAGPPAPAPDVAENEGVAPVQKPRGGSKSRRSSGRHGRRR
jgi:SecD/SecF fusion protein